MKVVINTCYGGFSISDEALEALAKRKGLTLYWFASLFNSDRLTALPLADVQASPTLSKRHYLTMAYTSPDAGDETYFENRPDDRSDPDLVAVVEELGERANGSHAQLKIVEIPDGVDYVVEEYDGRECVAEKHRTWA